MVETLNSSLTCSWPGAYIEAPRVVVNPIEHIIRVEIVLRVIDQFRGFFLLFLLFQSAQSMGIDK